jgi:hypothetical protein
MSRPGRKSAESFAKETSKVTLKSSIGICKKFLIGMFKMTGSEGPIVTKYNFVLLILANKNHV